MVGIHGPFDQILNYLDASSRSLESKDQNHSKFSQTVATKIKTWRIQLLCLNISKYDYGRIGLTV